ncbi:MAG: flavodoxin domain-containing protein [Acholeplasmatales bacterium]|nr:flavodoxin domain-containing protein [Acholeplasmatales bacterium]
MKSIVVYWSMTGNTEGIANLIGVDCDANVLSVSEANVDEVLSYDNIILGCPAMGAEVLEEEEFQPFYDELSTKLNNQRIFLFGSYGWGDGEWMRNWEEDAKNKGLNLQAEGLIVNGDSSSIDQEKYEGFINAIKEN